MLLGEYDDKENENEEEEREEEEGEGGEAAAAVDGCGGVPSLPCPPSGTTGQEGSPSRLFSLSRFGTIESHSVARIFDKKEMSALLHHFHTNEQLYLYKKIFF